MYDCPCFSVGGSLDEASFGQSHDGRCVRMTGESKGDTTPRVTIIPSHFLLTSGNILLNSLDMLRRQVNHPCITMTLHSLTTETCPSTMKPPPHQDASHLFLHLITHLLGDRSGLVRSGRVRSLQLPLEAKSVGAQKAFKRTKRLSIPSTNAVLIGGRFWAGQVSLRPPFCLGPQQLTPDCTGVMSGAVSHYQPPLCNPVIDDGPFPHFCL